MRTFTKDELIELLREIRQSGWHKGGRPGNDGSVGNTLEDLLGIEENNLPIANTSEWELKAQRQNTSSLTTLFHMEPSPRIIKFVPKVLLPLYGWRHDKTGTKYPETERSFRQTINARERTDRGFIIKVDRDNGRIVVSFDSGAVAPRHEQWLKAVVDNAGATELIPAPYWGFDDLYHKAGTKLHNCFLVKADTKIDEGVEYFHFTRILMLRGFSRERFIEAIESGEVYVDFDARTGHNHGTKFRIRERAIASLYEESVEL